MASRKQRPKSRSDSMPKNQAKNEVKRNWFQSLENNVEKICANLVDTVNMHVKRGNPGNKGSKGVSFKVKNKKVAPTKQVLVGDSAKKQPKESTKEVLLEGASKILPSREGKSLAGKDSMTNFIWHETGASSMALSKVGKSNNKEEVSLIQRSDKKKKLKPSACEALSQNASLREALSGVKKIVGMSRA